MREKRGQITLFIIAGIAILILAGLVMFLITYKEADRLEIENTEVAKLPSEIQAIHSSIKDCIYEQGERGLILIGKGGGQVNLIATPTGIESPVSNFIVDGKKDMPALTDIEDHLSAYMDYFIPTCAVDIDKTKEIIFNESKTEVRFVEDSVVMEVVFPVEVKYNEQSSRFSNFYIEYPIRMRKIYSLAEDVVDNTISDPEWIDFMKYKDIDMHLIINKYDETYKVFDIIDNNSRIDNSAYLFTFGSKSGPEKQMNLAPELLIPQSVEAKINGLFVFDVNALDPEGEPLEYSTNREDLFHIDPYSGLINFTPTENDKGTQLIEITAKDSAGNIDRQFMELVVK